MASIKDKVIKGDKEYNLTDFEWSFIQNLMINTELIRKQNNQSASAFLGYVAHNRLGFKEGEDLQFELDEQKKTVKITTLGVDKKS